MIKKLKKGFTLVELIVVIAIIAILSTVAVIGYTRVVDKANVSNDTQLVRNLNERLQLAEAETGYSTPETAHEAFVLTEDFGFIIEKLTPTSSGNDIVWDITTNRFALIDAEKVDNVLYTDPTVELSDNPVDLWKVYKEVPKLADQKYSIYLAGTNLAGIVDAKVGVDVGLNTISTINYTNPTDVAHTVVIRTNSASTTLTIDAALDTVKHYGSVGSLNIIAVASASYHEYGQVAFAEIAKGRIVLESGSEIKHIHVNANAAKDGFGTVIIADNGAKALPETISRDEVNVASETLVVKVESNGTTESAYVYPSAAIGTTQKTATQNASVVSELGMLVLDNESGSKALSEATKTETKTDIVNVAVGNVISVLQNGNVKTSMTLVEFRDKWNEGLFNNDFVSATLLDDVDLNGMEWTPIGTSGNQFKGTFNGSGNTITGLTDCLFKYATGSVTVKDLNVDVCIENTDEFVGAVIGVYDMKSVTDTTATVSIQNVTVTGSISANDKAGGIIGSQYNSSVGAGNNITFTLSNCVNKATVNAKRSGGLIGTSCGYLSGDKGNVYFKTIIDSCENDAVITSTSNTGKYYPGGYIGYCGGYGNYEIKNITNKQAQYLIGYCDIEKTPKYIDENPGFIKDEYVEMFEIDDYDYYYGHVGETVYTITLWKWHATLKQTQGSLRFTYYDSPSKLTNDEWRFTIDGKHYKFANGHVVDISSGTEQTSHVSISNDPNTYVVEGITVEYVENKPMNISGTEKTWTGYMATIGVGTYTFDPADCILPSERDNFTIIDNGNGTWTVTEK